jgi:hypothetical protein
MGAFGLTRTPIVVRRLVRDRHAEDLFFLPGGLICCTAALVSGAGFVFQSDPLVWYGVAGLFLSLPFVLVGSAVQALREWRERRRSRTSSHDDHRSKAPPPERQE